jgi:L-aspartate oxidase
MTGRCVGVRYLDPILRAPRDVFANGVILCTGGAGQLFLHTTNPPVATGDGMAMAYFAGAEMADMEFIQFHPTALSVEGAPRFLLSEAMRGEGGILRNSAGERFMDRYDERLELAPRDIVSRSIVAEMRRTGSRTVFLDMTALDAEFLRTRFPKIYETCKAFGLDIANGSVTCITRVALLHGRDSDRFVGTHNRSGPLRRRRGSVHGCSWREPSRVEFASRGIGVRRESG